MSILGGLSKGKKGRELAQVGLLAAVPAILLVAPLVGFFIGRWADRKFDPEPYLMIAGIVLGFAAAAREIFNLVKKSESLDAEKDDALGLR